MAMLVHATAVAIAGGAILLRGEPGSGKSSLALELIEAPGSGLGDGPLQASLISDDQTELRSENGRIWCSTPKALAGLLEVRGLGLLKIPVSGPAPLKLVVDLVAPDAAPRLPEANEMTAAIMGLSVPRLMLARNGAVLASRVRAAFLKL